MRLALVSVWLVAGVALLPSACTLAPTSPPAGEIVNDVTLLNPIRVERVVAPTSAEEVSRLVKDHSGPISIGGARHSMGGQIATEDALFLEMRDMNRVLAFSTEQKTITVQAGITWRKIQETIDAGHDTPDASQDLNGFPSTPKRGRDEQVVEGSGADANGSNDPGSNPLSDISNRRSRVDNSPIGAPFGGTKRRRVSSFRTTRQRPTTTRRR